MLKYIYMDRSFAPLRMTTTGNRQPVILSGAKDLFSWAGGVDAATDTHV